MEAKTIEIYTLPTFSDDADFEAYLNRVSAGEVAADYTATLTEEEAE